MLKYVDAVPYLGGVPALGTNPVGRNMIGFDILENVQNIIVLFSQYKIGNALQKSSIIFISLQPETNEIMLGSLGSQPR